MKYRLNGLRRRDCNQVKILSVKEYQPITRTIKHVMPTCDSDIIEIRFIATWWDHWSSIKWWNSIKTNRPFNENRFELHNAVNHTSIDLAIKHFIWGRGIGHWWIISSKPPEAYALLQLRRPNQTLRSITRDYRRECNPRAICLRATVTGRIEKFTYRYGDKTNFRGA